MDKNNLVKYAFEENMNILAEACQGPGAFSDEEFFRLTANTLHSAMDCIERIDCKEQSDWILGFKYANNALKHRSDLIEIQMKANGAILPQKLDGTGRFYHYAWTDSENLGKPRYAEQKYAYERTLMGKSVIATFAKIKDIINESI